MRILVNGYLITLKTKKMLEYIKQNKGVVTIICTIIGAAVAIIQALSPITKLAIDTNQKISVVEEVSRQNQEEIGRHKDYIRESEQARTQAMIGIATIIEQNKSIKEDVEALKDYNQEQLKRIEKFYEINPRIQRPTAVVYPMVNHQIHPYDLTNQ